ERTAAHHGGALGARSVAGADRRGARPRLRRHAPRPGGRESLRRWRDDGAFGVARRGGAAVGPGGRASRGGRRPRSRPRREPPPRRRPVHRRRRAAPRPNRRPVVASPRPRRADLEPPRRTRAAATGGAPPPPQPPRDPRQAPERRPDAGADAVDARDAAFPRGPGRDDVARGGFASKPVFATERYRPGTHTDRATAALLAPSAL